MSDRVVTVNNLCCIINPYAKCYTCKGVVCADCNNLIAGECPAGKEIGEHHRIFYLTSYERT